MSRKTLPPPPAKEDRLLTRREVAELLGFKPQTLARWRWSGKVDAPPEIRIGKAVRYRMSAVLDWIATRK